MFLIMIFLSLLICFWIFFILFGFILFVIYFWNRIVGSFIIKDLNLKKIKYSLIYKGKR